MANPPPRMVQAVEGGAPFLEATGLVEKKTICFRQERERLKPQKGKQITFCPVGKITNDANGK